MPLQFDTDLNALTAKVLKMGALTERMIHDTTQTLVQWNIDLFAPVPENEDALDVLQREIDEETIRLISVYTPVAADLRLLLMVTRISSELERIGDQTMNIGFYAKEMLKQEPLKPLIDLPRMAELAMEMLRNALDAFTQRSCELALDVIKSDDTVDQLNDQLFRELMTYLLTEPKRMPQGLELVLTSRAFERIADHAVGIAEDVFFMVQGQDIRHAEPPTASTDEES
jgi:phosphate transport system protein